MSSLDSSRLEFEELRNLELELHKADTRSNRKRLESLIHPNFVEFGRSGTRYSRADVLEEYDSNSILPTIRAENFDMASLSEGVVLLTYVSAHLDTAGKTHRRTLRSSIWVLTEAGWQMRFHQGTPASEAVTSLPNVKA